MKTTKILFVLILASVGLINQINAKIPDAILQHRLMNLPNHQALNDPAVNVEFCQPYNVPSPKKAKIKAVQPGQEFLDSIVSYDMYDGEISSGSKEEWGYRADGTQTYECSYSWDDEFEDWRGIRKTNTFYDAKGNLSMTVNDRWNMGTKEWIKNQKVEMTYDSNGNVTLYQFYSWNPTTIEWELFRKQETVITYTLESAYIEVSISTNFDKVTNEWTFSHRNELHYDKLGNLILYNASYWDSVANSWVFKDGSFKYEHAYDDNGNQTLKSYYRWDSEMGGWSGSSSSDLIESTYDAHGNATIVVNKKWNDTLNEWGNSIKSESSYNANGLELETVLYQWNQEQHEWVGISKQEFIYNDKGLLSLSKGLQVDSISGDWYVNAKEEYTYDADKNEVLKEAYKLNDEDLFTMYFKQETFYDTYGKLSRQKVYKKVYFSWMDATNISNKEINYTYNQIGDKLIEVATTDSTEMDYQGTLYQTVSTSTKQYYYSTFVVTSSFDQKSATPSVYPNPFSDQLSIQLNNNNQIVFELFDVQGRKVITSTAVNTRSINTSDLDEGVYIYKLSSKGNVQTGRLIKR